MEVYGCQMNVADSSEIKLMLNAAGWQEVLSSDEADAVIINTCSVRKTAEERVDGRIGFYKNLKGRKDFTLFLMGCYAQKEGEALKKRFPFIDYVIGTRNRLKIPEILISQHKKAFSSSSVYTSIENSYEEIKPSFDPLFPYRAFVSVISGCNNFCSYCIVPYTRGREVSLSSAKVLEYVKELADKGVKEVFLLGQNVNSYGKYPEDISFSKLLEKISLIDSIERIRFLTSHPKDFSDELIDTVTTLPKLAKHIHLPLQSGSNRILEAMNRKYSYEHYRSIIDRIRKKNESIHFSTDILLGFPGETQKDFEDTYNAVKDIEYSKSFIFMYSPREGTAASKLKESISRDEKQQRVQKVIDLQGGITEKFLKSFIGKEVNILVEGESKKGDGKMLGSTEYDFRMVLPATKEDIGNFKKVTVKELLGKTLTA